MGWLRAGDAEQPGEPARGEPSPLARDKRSPSAEAGDGATWEGCAHHGPCKRPSADSSYQNTCLRTCCGPLTRNSSCNFCLFPWHLLPSACVLDGCSSCRTAAASLRRCCPSEEEEELPTQTAPVKSARKAALRHRKRSPTFVAHPAGILPLLLVPAQTSDTGTQQQGKNTPGVPGLTPRARGATAGLGIVSAPRGPALPTAAVLGALPEATASALGRRGARPPLPGTERGAALSRQVPINGVFYLTGEIKSLYRERRKRDESAAG